MSRGNFYENEFINFDQYEQLVNNHNFALDGCTLFPRDIEAVKLERHVKFLRENTKLFETINEETYYRTIEGTSGLAEKYTKILVSENPYNSRILNEYGINGRNFINFLKVSSGSDQNIFFPLPREDGGVYPIPRQDYTLVRHSLGWNPDFLYEKVDDYEFVIFTVNNFFV